MIILNKYHLVGYLSNSSNNLFLLNTNFLQHNYKHKIKSNGKIKAIVGKTARMMPVVLS